MKHKHLFLLLGILWLQLEVAKAQIPVELLAGDKKASIDLMFFKFFKNKDGQNSRMLFFSRERAVFDYQQSSPQFGFTEAISYNHPALKGWAPVLVGQVLNRGTFAKSGIQYAHLSQTMTIFGWSVVELNQRPNIDLFLMLRFTPRLGHQWHFYSQLELINSFPTDANTAFSFTQRLRLGLKRGAWQFGLGGDYSAIGRQSYVGTQNSGFFLRHEF